MRIAVVGSGYVGLVAGACFADAGNRVVMVDRDPTRVEDINAARCPIYEPGLPEILDRVRANGHLVATTDLAQGLDGAVAVFIAVGTPSAEDGSADLSAVDAVAAQIAAIADRPLVVVTKSTVPPGTNARLVRAFAASARVPISVVSNPEFLKEGTAVTDFQKPERVIIGSDDPAAVETMRRLYAPFMARSDRMIVMDPMSAEITKYACNAMLATRVSFMNDIARLCEHLGADVTHVRRGMGTDARIGPHFLYASLGYGGSCFPKDVAALAHLGQALSPPMELVVATESVNRTQRRHVAQRAVSLLGDPAGKRVAVWGLAFKANTDDVRESPALEVVSTLRAAGAHCVVHDPEAVDNALREIGADGITVVDDNLDALDGADLLVICTEWSQYRTPDLEAMQARMNKPVILDGRSLYQLEWFDGTPIAYHSVGRPSVGGA